MTVTNTGSFVLFTPETDEEKEWINDNVATESWQWLGESLAVDARFAGDLADGMMNDGIDLKE